MKPQQKRTTISKYHKNGTIVTPIWASISLISLGTLFLLPPLTCPAQTPEQMLPQVEYQGPIEKRGVPDLRLGVAIYKQYFNFKNGLEHHLIEIGGTTPPENLVNLLYLHTQNKLESIKFTYPVGIKILCIPKEKIILVDEEGSKIRAFRLSRTPIEEKPKNPEQGEDKENDNNEEPGDGNKEGPIKEAYSPSPTKILRT
jgi:hypothetical protein